MTIFFTSDIHFGHANILKHANRPFSNIEEMDEQIIKNWNSVVGRGDEIYVLGDFCLGKPEYGVEILKRLHGKKILIEGNHDKHCLKNAKFCSAWHKLSSLHEIKVSDKDAHGEKQNIVLCHYAMRVWNKSHHGSWHLYGHSHGSLKDDPNSRSFDVGVDCHNFTPISYDEVKQIMSKKSWKPIDHHGADQYKED